jgi:hypothetical protein
VKCIFEVGSGGIMIPSFVPIDVAIKVILSLLHHKYERL